MDSYVFNSLKSIFNTDQLKFYTESKIYFSYEMKFCNGLDPVSFTDSYIRFKFPPSEGKRQETTAITLDQLIPEAFTVLSYDENNGIGIKHPVFKNQEKALTCLKDFMSYYKHHERSLSILKQQPNLTETQICEVLAAHLFEPLVPGKDVILWNGMKNRSKDGKCPCGCQFNVKNGPTGIGHGRVWHGYPDLMVKHTAVSIQPLDDQNIDTDDSEQPGGSTTKRLKLENTFKDIHEEEMCNSVDVKTNETSIYSNNFMTQLVSQSITNGFSQKGASQLRNQMIPSIGCDLHDFHIFLYDPDSDILMRRMECLEIFSKESPHRLILPSVVELWLILNLHTFGSSMSEVNASRLNKFGFKNLMEKENVLSYYSEAIVGAERNQFNSWPKGTNHKPSLMLRDLMLRVV